MTRLALITCGPSDWRELAAVLEARGWRLHPYPVVRLEEHTDRLGWRRAERALERIAWLLVTTPRSARFLVEQSVNQGHPELLERPVVAIGPDTATAAAALGLAVELTGDGRDATLVGLLTARWTAPVCLLLARGADRSSQLRAALERSGHEVLELVTHRFRATPSRELPAIGPSQVVVLTSPLAARFYLEAVGGHPLPVPHVAVGPTTRDGAAALGIDCLLPSSADLDALADTVCSL